MITLAYVTEDCRQQAQLHGQLEETIRLAEKVNKNQSISNWDQFLPHPIIKKSLGKSFRLIAQKRVHANFPDVQFICFLHVIPRGGSEYKTFLKNPLAYCASFSPSDTEISKYHNQTHADQQVGFTIPSESEYHYLYSGLGMKVDGSSTIYESRDWVQWMKRNDRDHLMTRYYDLITEKIQDSDPTMLIRCSKSNALLWACKINSEDLFLIAPLLHNESVPDELQHKYGSILSDPTAVTEEMLLRLSGRSYPSLVLADESIWKAIQSNDEGNLALSPEEAELLESVSHSNNDNKAYPLFINGRPGSGKSTILQYLFAGHLYQYLYLIQSDPSQQSQPPIYLTYGAKLLDVAKSSVKTIIECNSKYMIYRQINTTSENFDQAFKESFHEFHRFLLQLLSPEARVQFDEGRRVEYANFLPLWLNYRKSHPNHEIRELSAELVWHIIRTYIKGMRDDQGNYLDTNAYSELPRAQKTVQVETYKNVYEVVWEWYSQYCEDNQIWDAQDLARAVLNSELDLAAYPVVFCDEAQDFTRNELELILHLSLFSRRALEPELLSKVPFAFAGDPYQTLNPTGFDWSVVQAGFHETIIQGLDRFSRSKLEFNFRELSYNYRSTNNIVRFCNLLQLLRGILFDVQNLKPQEIWFDDPNSPMPVYFSIDDMDCRKKLEEQTDIVIILPCQEGEEIDYIKSDPYLALITHSNEVTRNFLSPISAKGLEFSRVVLYKFGASLAENYPTFFDPLNQAGPHVEHEEALPLQYFMNRLYVGASRAQKRLIIVDTDQGLNYLWKNHQIPQFEQLITRYGSDKWSGDDLIYVAQGIPSNWSEDRDNPLELARKFHESGEAERDTYKLRLAAKNYRDIRRFAEAQLCDAKRYEYESDYVKAAETYLQIDLKPQALACYWHARAYQQILEGPFRDTLEQRSAHFMLSRKRRRDCEELLRQLGAAIEQNQIQHSKDAHWNEILSSLLAALVSSPANEIDKTDWSVIYQKVQNLQKKFNILNFSQLGEVAYRAGEYKSAVEIWDSQPMTLDIRLNYARAKAEITDYPGKLEFLGGSENYEEVQKLWHENPNVRLKHEQQSVVYEALIGLKKYEEVNDLLESSNNPRLVEDLLPKIKRHGLQNLSQDEIVAFVRLTAKFGQWKNALDLVKSRANDTRLHLALIDEASTSETLPNAPIAVRELVEQYLGEHLLRKESKISVDIRVAGAAIERAGRIIDALEFYERIWQKRIDATEDQLQFAHERWVKSKLRQANYTRYSKRQSDGDDQEKDARRRATAWNVKIDDIPEYPEFDVAKPTNLDEDKLAVIRDLTEKGWSAEKIAKVLSLPLETVIHAQGLGK
jgi:hypothetical protein